MRGIFVIAIFGILSWFFLNQGLRDHLAGFSLNGIAFGLAVTAVAFLLEACALGWKASSLRKVVFAGPSQKRDLAIFFMDISTVWHLLGWMATLGVLSYLGSQVAWVLSHWTDDNLLSQIPSVIAQALILAVAFDFMSYWQHRAFHHFPFLWELHKYHHTATDLTIITARRDHYLISPFFALTFAVPSIVLGHATGQIWWISGLLYLHGLLTHSGLRGHWGPIGRYILISPEAHRLHHSALREHFDRNFGALTPLWDRVFGTYLEPTKVTDQDYPLGVEAELHNRRNLLTEMDAATIRSLRAMWPKRSPSPQASEPNRESGTEVTRVVG